MSYTRAQLVTLTEESLDAVSSSRWGSTLKLQTLSLVHARGWRRILNAHRATRWASRSVTTDSNGRVALSDLSSGSGDSQERLYKVLAVANGQRRYRLGEFMDDPMALVRSTSQMADLAWRQGDYLQMQPATEGDTLTVWVNHLPTPISELSADSVAVTWPTDYEPILAFEAAAILAAKGGAETDVSQTMTSLAADLWNDLLADLSRWHTDPLYVQASDSPHEWGSI